MVTAKRLSNVNTLVYSMDVKDLSTNFENKTEIEVSISEIIRSNILTKTLLNQSKIDKIKLILDENLATLANIPNIDDEQL